MTRIVFELTYFFIGKIQTVWAQMLLNYIVRLARYEWIEVKIKKHEDFSSNLRNLLDAERFRRSSGEPKPESDER